MSSCVWDGGATPSWPSSATPSSRGRTWSTGRWARSGFSRSSKRRWRCGLEGQVPVARVYNGQLGRDMEYLYDRGNPERQFAAVFNINRCIGCQTCTMACKSAWTFSDGQEYMWWNNVESKPYGGYPQNWDVKTLSLLEKANPGGQA